jgi:biopolymer transport protein ExbB
MSFALKNTLIWSGIVTIVAPMLGLAGTVIGMMSSFQSLGQSGVANMEGLSSNISVVLISAAIGCGIGLVGFITLITALIYYFANRNKSATSPLAS